MSETCTAVEIQQHLQKAIDADHNFAGVRLTVSVRRADVAETPGAWDVDIEGDGEAPMDKESCEVALIGILTNAHNRFILALDS